VKAYISKRAARAAERIDARWREHADDAGIFAREFLEAIELLESSRVPGSPHPTVKHPALKRVLLTKSRCHLYFEIDDVNQTIQILHVWDGRRARPPQL
jgi:hypothetical protein